MSSGRIRASTALSSRRPAPAMASDRRRPRSESVFNGSAASGPGKTRGSSVDALMWCLQKLCQVGRVGSGADELAGRVLGGPVGLELEFGQGVVEVLALDPVVQAHVAAQQAVLLRLFDGLVQAAYVVVVQQGVDAVAQVLHAAPALLVVEVGVAPGAGPQLVLRFP